QADGRGCGRPGRAGQVLHRSRRGAARQSGDVASFGQGGVRVGSRTGGGRLGLGAALRQAGAARGRDGRLGHRLLLDRRAEVERERRGLLGGGRRRRGRGGGTAVV